MICERVPFYKPFAKLSAIFRFEDLKAQISVFMLCLYIDPYKFCNKTMFCLKFFQSKKKGNNQELIQSKSTYHPQNQNYFAYFLFKLQNKTKQKHNGS